MCSPLSRLPESKTVLSSSVQASQVKVQKDSAAVKIEMGTWKSVKSKQATFTDRNSVKAQKQRGTSPTEVVLLSALFVYKLPNIGSRMSLIKISATTQKFQLFQLYKCYYLFV